MSNEYLSSKRYKLSFKTGFDWSHGPRFYGPRYQGTIVREPNVSKCLLSLFSFSKLLKQSNDAQNNDWKIKQTITKHEDIKRAAQCENMSSGICGQQRPRSACASAQADQGLCCPLTESLDTIECMNWEQIPRWYFAHAWDESKSVHFMHARRHIFALRGPTSRKQICFHRFVSFCDLIIAYIEQTSNRPHQAKTCLRVCTKWHVQIILHIFKVPSRPLLSFHIFYRIQWFCKRTTKALIRLCGCAGWSGPSLSAYARRHDSLRAA